MNYGLLYLNCLTNHVQTIQGARKTILHTHAHTVYAYQYYIMVWNHLTGAKDGTERMHTRAAGKEQRKQHMEGDGKAPGTIEMQILMKTGSPEIPMSHCSSSDE